MKIYQDISSIPVFKDAVITIGTFDGVHQGHQQILNQLVEEANNINGTAIVITFDPHPREVLKTKDNKVLQLTSLSEKAALLSKFSIEHLVVIPFTKDFSEQTAEEYIQYFLVNNFKPRKIIIGYDHRFGKNRAGDYQLLLNRAETYQYELIEIPEKIIATVTISSTQIRKMLLEGNIIAANNLLGHPYSFSGNVIHGNELGRTIGYPTANISINDESKLIPSNGVYAVRIKLENNDTNYEGMMNIGIRPTVHGTNRTIEVHIFDFDDTIYDTNVIIYLFAKLREEKKFEGLIQLKEQLLQDKINTLEFFETNTP